MRVQISEEAGEDLSRYDRSRSLSINSSNAVDDEVVSNASSVTLSFQHNDVTNEDTNGDRLASIENMLIVQQGLLHKLLSNKGACLPRAPESERSYLSPVDCNLGDHYKQARIEAGFQDQAEWNAAYIHGLVRIDGQQSKSTTLNPACGRCAESRNVAICIGLAEEDPYYEHLVINERTCCGWCECEKIHHKEEQRSYTTEQKDSDPPNDEESQEGSLEAPEIHFVEYCDQGSQQGKNSIYFIDGEGISREVITADIPRYMGNDSLVRPGSYFNSETAKTIQGFYIKAYRPPTSAMLEDLRADSKAWQAERTEPSISDVLEREAKRKREQYTLFPKAEYFCEIPPLSNWGPYQTAQNGGQN